MLPTALIIALGLRGEIVFDLSICGVVTIGAGFVGGFSGAGTNEYGGSFGGPYISESSSIVPTDGAMLRFVFWEFDLGSGGVLGGVLVDTAIPIHDGRGSGKPGLPGSSDGTGLRVTIGEVF